MWYMALTSSELHLARVRACVPRGSHGIPEHEVRRRPDASRHNLLELLPDRASLRVHDNSAEADPATGTDPAWGAAAARGARANLSLRARDRAAWGTADPDDRARGSTRSVIATVGPPHLQLDKVQGVKEFSR
jgi:hypothetical protein